MNGKLRRLSLSILGPLALAATSQVAPASSLPPGFIETPVARPDGHPWEGAEGVVSARDGRVFVWERTGRIWIVPGTNPRSAPLIDIADEVSTIGSLGLTGFALDPGFDSNGYIYLFYAVEPQHLSNCDSPKSGAPVCRATFRAGEHASRGATIGRLVRFQLVRPRGASDYRTAIDVSPESRTVLLGETPTDSDVPTGCVITSTAQGPGGLAFGTDRTLLAACGDGADALATDTGSNPDTEYQQAVAAHLMTPNENVGAFRAQLVDSLSGKILRLNAMTGDGLPGNPFYDAAAPRSARSRVWMLGLHDPRHFVVRPGTGSSRISDANPGSLYIGELGRGGWESLVVAADSRTNFGWPVYESLRARRTGDQDSLPPAGGVWFGGRDFPAPFYDVYFHADAVGEWIKAFEFDSADNPVGVRDFLEDGGPIRALGADARSGSLYYVTGELGSEVRRLTYSRTGASALAGSSAVSGGSASPIGAAVPGTSSTTATARSQAASRSPSGSRTAPASAKPRASLSAVAQRSAVTAAATAPTWSNSDIGSVGVAGSFTLSSGTFTVKGSGADIWNTADAFQFVYQPLTGDGSITARVVSQTNTNAWAKAGIMFRGSLSANSINAFVGLTPSNGAVIQARTTAGGSSVGGVGAKVAAPYWLRLVRTGNTFTGSISQDGTTWTPTGQETVTMASQVQVGLAVTSHANGTVGTVVFDNVTIVSNVSTTDTQAPTVPTGLAASAVTSTGLTLSWSPSTDLPNPGGTGIGGYFVYRNGNIAAPIATVTAGTTFNDTGLAAATIYQYQVAAFDQASPPNISAPSPTLSVTTQSGSPSPWTNSDIGSVGAAGSFTVSSGTLTVKGSGADIWNKADAFQFVYQPLIGDGSITARVVSQTNTNAWAKAGVMFRATLSAGSVNAFVGITPSNGAVIQARTTTGSSSVGGTGPTIAAPYWLRLVRTGNTFTASVSPDGTTWTSIGQETVTMPSQVQVGLAVTSHASGTLGTVVFDNVTVTTAGKDAVTLAPQRAALTLSQKQQFTATTASGAAIAWEVDGVTGGNSTVGTVSTAGLYTPPPTAGVHAVTATNASATTNFATATVAVTDIDGVFTYHTDAARTGQNTREYQLTPTSVRSGNFGKRWSCTLDGAAWAQPLYVANLTIGGGVHNVLIVATEHDSVYAFDADDPGCVSYWHVSLLSAGATPIPPADPGCNNIPVEIGITGTPVIDPATQTLYLVAATKESGNYFQRLHAIQLSTGKERTGSPVNIQAAVRNASGATVSFSPLWENQRPGLAFSSGAVYIGWASHCDNGSWWGWLMRYDAASLAQTAVFNVAPDGIRGGIWMSGGAPAVDSTGSLFFSTGNGTFDDTGSVVPPVAPNGDFGESFLKLDPTSLAVQDFYTPSSEAAWSDADFDISSGGVTVLPDGAGPSAHPNVILGADKQGHLWMIDRNQMRRFSGTSDNVVQFLTMASTPNCTDTDEHCVYVTPTYWNGTVYISISSGSILALPLSNGLIPATAQDVVAPTSQSQETYGFPSPTGVISASPDGNGILWALDNVANGSGGVAKGPAILRAYDALDLSSTLYSSSALKSDAAGTAVKFTVPVVANGHVYVGGNGQLTVYGLSP